MNAPIAFDRSLFPTAYLRYERRDTACPSMVLQQWHCGYQEAGNLTLPEYCPYGEWRDVPIVQGAPFIDPDKERLADKIAEHNGLK